MCLQDSYMHAGNGAERVVYHVIAFYREYFLNNLLHLWHFICSMPLRAHLNKQGVVKRVCS